MGQGRSSSQRHQRRRRGARGADVGTPGGSKTLTATLNYLTHFEPAGQGTRLVASARRAAEAATWEPDDPRIAELATAAAEHYLANPAMLKTVTGLQARTESATRYTLIAHHGQEPMPAAARLTALFETKLRAAGIAVPRPHAH